MKKIKVFRESSAALMQTAIDEWLVENPDINIISINPTDSSSQHGSRNMMCYILYEQQKTEADLLKS